MKKTAALLLALPLLVFASVPALAQSALIFDLEETAPSATTTPTLPEGQIQDGLFVEVGDTVTLRGEVDGDAYLVGGVINIEGRVRGDVLAVGGVINLSGEVTDDIRLVGGVINIDGAVGKNASLVGGTIRIGPKADIKGSVLGGGGALTLSGRVRKHLKFSGDTIDFGGEVGRDADLTGENIQLQQQAHISRDLIYHARSRDYLKVSPQAHIQGQTVFQPFLHPISLLPLFGSFGSEFPLLKFILALCLGWVLYKLFPRQMDGLAGLVKEQPAKSLALGFLALILTPVLIILLLVSVIGIPIALVILPVFIGILAFHEIVIGTFLGRKVIFKFLNKTKIGKFWQFAGGLLVYDFVIVTPFVGRWIKWAGLLIGMGAVLTLIREAYLKLTLSKKK